MGRPARRLWTLAACGLCILGALGAIAAASPAHAVSRHPKVAAKRCRKARSRARVARARRAASCPTSRHSRKKARPAPAAPAPSASAPASTPASTTGSGAPAAVAPAAPTEAPETKAPPSVPHVQVTAVEYHYTLSRTSVPAGKVVLQFVNDGEDEHNLNVIPGEGAPAATFANLASKAMSSQEIELRPGSYTLFCSLPEHEKKGMKATLTVE